MSATSSTPMPLEFCDHPCFNTVALRGERAMIKAGNLHIHLHRTSEQLTVDLIPAEKTETAEPLATATAFFDESRPGGSRRAASYATVGWTPEDIRGLRRGWSLEEAEAWLTRHEVLLRRCAQDHGQELIARYLDAENDSEPPAEDDTAQARDFPEVTFTAIELSSHPGLIDAVLSGYSQTFVKVDHLTVELLTHHHGVMACLWPSDGEGTEPLATTFALFSEAEADEVDLGYATVGWTSEDIRCWRGDWSEAEAEDWLADHEESICESIRATGLRVIENCLDMGLEEGAKS